MPGTGHVAFSRACRAWLPEGKQIGADRAERASSPAELINEREADGVRWASTADQDAAVKALMHALPARAWQEPTRGCGDEIAETVPARAKTPTAFRRIIQREPRRQPDWFDPTASPSGYHVGAGTWPVEAKTAREGLSWPPQRGQAENVFTELTSGVGLERMPCGETWANAVFIRLGVLAAPLFVGVQRLACPAAWASATSATGRWQRSQLAGRVGRPAGQVMLKLGVDRNTLARVQGIRQHCWQLSGEP